MRYKKDIKLLKGYVIDHAVIKDAHGNIVRCVMTAKDDILIRARDLLIACGFKGHLNNKQFMMLSNHYKYKVKTSNIPPKLREAMWGDAMGMSNNGCLFVSLEGSWKFVNNYITDTSSAISVLEKVEEYFDE